MFFPKNAENFLGVFAQFMHHKNIFLNFQYFPEIIKPFSLIFII